MFNLQKEYTVIQHNINKLVKEKKDVPVNLYERQFQIITEINDVFERQKDESIKSYTMGLRYNKMLMYFAQKIGKPVEAYINKMNEYAIKLTGEPIKPEELIVNE